MCVCISYLILLYFHVLNLGGDYPLGQTSIFESRTNTLQVPEGVAWFVWVDVSTWFVVHQRKVPLGEASNMEAMFQLYVGKIFQKLFDKQASRTLGSNFGKKWTSFPRVNPGILRDKTSKSDVLVEWLNGLSCKFLGWRNGWKKSFLLFLHSLKPTVRPESRPGPRRKRSSYFQTLLFRSF